MRGARYVLTGALLTACSLNGEGLTSPGSDSGAADDRNVGHDGRVVHDAGAADDGAADDVHVDRSLPRESGPDGSADHSVHDGGHPPADAGSDAHLADSSMGCDASLASDPENCGACGHGCGGGGCQAGVCQPEDLVSIAAGRTVRAIAIDSTYLYWSNTTEMTIVRANLDGTGQAPILMGVSANEIAVGASALYYTDGSLHVLPFSSMVSSIVASGPDGCIWLTGSGQAYTAEFVGGNVLRVDLGGAGVTTLLSGLTMPWGVASTATELYWTSSGTDAGSISRQALPAGSAQAIGSSLDNPNCLTFDETGRLYWPDYFSGVIERSNPDGTDATTLATGQVTPTTVAVNAKYLYWNSANHVVRLAR